MRDRWRISRAEFESLVDEAMASLPAEFGSRLVNIVIVVEEEPTDEDLELLEGEEDDEDDELLGIYRGNPLTGRSWSDVAPMPDQIAIFRGPILRIAGSRQEAVEEIRDTVIHELGHYFGLDDDEMPF